ncbi:MAG: hypothetical protein HQL29_04440 [Candidatus Omnitrophica bacterium]|nr:hypothetical protein [Candidatus Omnitrophota bacterium]
MKKGLIVVTVMMFIVGVMDAGVGSAQENSAASLLRSGLLGAGSGAIAGAAGGADSDKLWISALTGAGVNIIGGTLLDVITERPSQAKNQPAYNQTVYAQRKQPRQIVQTSTVPQQSYVQYRQVEVSYEDLIREAYEKGLKDGYKQGYTEGYRDGVRDR